MSVPPALAPFEAAQVFSPLNLRFAEALERIARTSFGVATPPAVMIGAAAVSAALSRGDICLELGRAPLTLKPTDEAAALDTGPLPWPEPAEWRAALARSPLVGPPVVSERPRPLVLDGERLYLHRYWDYQRRLTDALLARRERILTIDEDRLQASLEKLFGDRHDPDQRRAAELAARRGLAIISGGPGTGKTSTVVRILAALLEQDASLSVALVAPTGKAAMRLSGSIREQRAALPLSAELLERLPDEASTIHRRLEWRPEARTRFRHDADNPLPADLVVLDEASMVDLALMTKLVESVKPDARLILIGDKDQLASVAAGHVLGDIADAAAPGGPLAEAFALLGTSHRFVPAIGALAQAIQRGDPDEVLALLRMDDAAVRWLQPDDETLRQLALAGWSGLARAVHAQPPSESLKLLERFQILCAHRRGRWGSETLTQHIAGWLVEANEIPPHREWFIGRPVIVTVNDAALGLFNGDVGIACEDLDGVLRVHFPSTVGSGGGSTRALAPSQLPTYDPFYATTVHKAQGSGFDEVVVVLPQEPSPVLTRELLYTAVTRARKRVTLVANEAVLRHAVKARVERASGLRMALGRGTT